MKNFFIIILILLNSCSTAKVQNESKIDINYSENLTIDEFKLKLEKYAEYGSYPNID